MNFLVGTLYSGENEVVQCLESISRQDYGERRQVIVEGFSHRTAHEELYRYFMSQSEWADYFVKIDADMVLIGENVFEDIDQFLHPCDEIRNLELAVHDFYTDRLIWGLHVYRSDVQWQFKDELFVDRRPVSTDEHLYLADRVAPVAEHSPNPSNAQALMHGLKRGLKTLELTNDSSSGIEFFYRKILNQLKGFFRNQYNRDDFPGVLANHWEGHQRIMDRFENTRNVKLGLSAIGYELGLTGAYEADSIDYSSSDFHGVMEQYSSNNYDQVKQSLEEIRSRNWGILPDGLRRKLLRFLYQVN